MNDKVKMDEVGIDRKEHILFIALPVVRMKQVAQVSMSYFLVVKGGR